VDIDVDVPKLQQALFRKGYDYLENHDYEKGRTMYKALLLLVPEDAISTYNLACAESLLGNREEAVKVLRRAVELGYDNLSHLVVDTDLKNISDMPEFLEIVTKLKVRQIPQPFPVESLQKPKPVPVQEPVKEFVKPEPVPVQEPVKESLKELEPQKPESPKQPEPVSVITDHEPIYVPCLPFPTVPVSYSNPIFQKWEAELLVLHDVGYFDDDLLVEYLERTKGSVEQTVLALLDM